MNKIRSLILLHFLILVSMVEAQVTFPVNGVADNRHITYAFKNARIVADAKTVVDSATLIIRDGKIEEMGKGVVIPADAVVYNLAGKSIYPSFIDPYTTYGMPSSEKAERQRGPQINSNTKGAYSWNQALKPEFQAYRVFSVNNETARGFRKAGFGAVCSFNDDGIARGTGCVVTLADQKEQEVMVLERAGAFYSFNKGSSSQDYPTSQMGAIALLRQSFLDAAWYKQGGKEKEYNISIQAWIDNQGIPQIFETSNKLESPRVDKIGDEFGVKYIIKGAGDEYQRLNEIKATQCSFILPVKFPEALDVSEPYDALNVNLEDLKHWEMAPANARMLNDAGVEIAFTSQGLKDPSDFLPALRKMILYGLSPEVALKACTETPAKFLGISAVTGALRKGMLADFIITSGDLFKKDNVIFENWVKGERYIIQKSYGTDVRGVYNLDVKNTKLTLKITGEPYQLKAVIEKDSTITKTDVSFENEILSLQFELKSDPGKGNYNLNGFRIGDAGKGFKGTGTDPSGSPVTWDARYLSAAVADIKIDTAKIEKPVLGAVWYPNKAFGFDTLPVAQTVLFRNVTVWTNEKEGILENTDVLITNGKISAIGKSLVAGNATVIDGTGKHLTSGIIDEHSHIAISNDVNECSHSVTAEVRIGDVLDPDDINIYRQLSGGVTTSQLLHGSCNPIGGQSAIIKLRWGQPAEKLKLEGAPGFIKFALGENVKQSNWGDDYRIRYPQSRMGVEQVYIDAFTRAKEYDEQLKAWKPGIKNGLKPRRDLTLEALVEITNKKRFITCHSYQQGEINMLMHVADSMGFKINTFTHILEGYKVADKLKAHGAGASSFSDWWAYKYEVMEAIPYNGAILHDMGVIVAYNSDDAEMARRLNQEAAKAVKYGGISEEEAFKFVTLNPAKLLHIDDKIGSVKVGKDADVVLWNGNPLSIYSKVLQTYIDGVCYYDVDRDQKMREELIAEKARIIKKMMAEKNTNGGEDMKKPTFKIQTLHHCRDNE